MKKQADRRAIVVSAVLTLLVLLGVGGVFFGARLVAAANSSPAPAPQRIDGTQADALAASDGAAAAADDEIVAAYQVQLQEAYQALTEAYAQIDSLQTAQAQPSYDDNDDHDDAREHDRQEEKPSRKHDDKAWDHGQERSAQEHDDD